MRRMRLGDAPGARWRGVAVWTAAMCVVFSAAAGGMPQAGKPIPGWQEDVRRFAEAKDWTAALAIVDSRLAQAPDDLEARGWRGRVLAWSGRWAEGEMEYRTVLDFAPEDADILTALADVLLWQGRNAEAILVLDRALAASANSDSETRAGLHLRRGRALRAMENRGEARAEFQQALALSPRNKDARAGIDSVPRELRQEFRAGADYDLLNFASNAQSYSVDLRSHWNHRWTTTFGGSFHERFGGNAGKLGGSASYDAGRGGVWTLGGAGGPDDGVISKGEAFLEYSRSFRKRPGAFVRGVELFYRQRWLWFRDGRVLTLGPGWHMYLPRDWIWTLQVTPARSRFAGTPAEWSPSGLTRLTFPVRRTVTGNVFFAAGAENFANADQVGRFSARTWGGGARWRFSERQDAGFYVAAQDRSQGRRQTSIGFSYGLSY